MPALANEEPETIEGTSGKYAAHIRPLLEELSANPPTLEEREQADKEVEALKDALNANRLKDRAEPIF